MSRLRGSSFQDLPLAPPTVDSDTRLHVLTGPPSTSGASVLFMTSVFGLLLDVPLPPSFSPLPPWSGRPPPSGTAERSFILVMSHHFWDLLTEAAARQR